MVVYRFIWPYMAVYGRIWPYMVVYGCICMYMSVYGCMWLYMDMWLCVAAYDCIWLYIAVYGSIWLLTAVDGCIWVYMIEHGFNSAPLEGTRGPSRGYLRFIDSYIICWLCLDMTWGQVVVDFVSIGSEGNSDRLLKMHVY